MIHHNFQIGTNTKIENYIYIIGEIMCLQPSDKCNQALLNTRTVQKGVNEIKL